MLLVLIRILAATWLLNSWFQGKVSKEAYAYILIPTNTFGNLSLTLDYLITVFCISSIKWKVQFSLHYFNVEFGLKGIVEKLKP